MLFCGISSRRSSSAQQWRRSAAKFSATVQLHRNISEVGDFSKYFGNFWKAPVASRKKTPESQDVTRLYSIPSQDYTIIDLSDFLGSESGALMAFSTKASDNPKGFSNFLGQKLSRWSIHIKHKAWIEFVWGGNLTIFHGNPLFTKRWLVLKGMHCVDP